jgi:ferredoxin--NADP+ reductase
MDEPAAKTASARILWVRRWSPRLLSFRIEREAGFRFVPGQFARLGLLKENGVPVWRAYSMASATWDDYLEFYSILVPGGAFTRSWKAGRGDSLMIERSPTASSPPTASPMAATCGCWPPAPASRPTWRSCRTRPPGSASSG